MDKIQLKYNSIENIRECVVCMADYKDTIALPCRHLCLCSQCAEQLRYQSNKCPICRQGFFFFFFFFLSQNGSDQPNMADI